MATVDWKIPANGKLVKFVVEKYGVPAAEAAFRLSAGTIRGYCFRERIQLGASVLAASFDVRELADFCKSAGIKSASLVDKHGEAISGILGDVEGADLKAAQAAYNSKFETRGVYVPARPSKPEPEVVQDPTPPAPVVSESSSVPTPCVEPPRITAKVNKNVPVRNRIPPVEDIRSMEQELTTGEAAEHLELEVDMPGENPARLAQLKKKFPNAVSIFKVKPVLFGALKVNCCRTPLWNLARECLAEKPEKRIRYDDTYPDASRYVCGNPTDSSDSFTCRECRRQLGEAPRASTKKFYGKGDSSSRRFG